MSRRSLWRRVRGPLRLGLVRALLWLFGRLSLGGAQRLGAGIGALLWRTNGKTRRVVEDNLARCLPELGAAERERLGRETMIEAGKTLVETGPLWRWPRERVEAMVVDTPGFETLEDALAAGHGAILLGPHLGAWELGGLMTAARTPTTIMYRPPREAALESLMVEARARFGAAMAPANLRGVRQALAALRRNELVAILPDQEPARGEGVFAPFFGEPALTMTLVRSLMRRTGAPAFMGYAERLPAGRGFRIHYRPARQPLDAEAPVKAATALNREVEALARERLAQYQWTYRRFRSRPPTEDETESARP